MKKRISERLSLSAVMHEIPMPGCALVEILDTDRVLIENHLGVTQYEEEIIRVRTKFGGICISGQQLALTGMTRGKLEIKGRIRSVSLQREDEA